MNTSKKLLLLSVIVLILLLIMYIIKPFNRSFATTTTTITPKPNSAIDSILSRYMTQLPHHSPVIHSLSRSNINHSIDQLWVDTSEVTQGDVYKFIFWSKVNDITPHMAATTSQADFTVSTKNNRLSGKNNVAANGINFYTAYSYCSAAGGRLPTTAELYTIANGNNTIFPWGDSFSNRPWPYFDVDLNATIPPQNTLGDITPSGVKNLSSLVSEWTMGDYPVGDPDIFGGNAYLQPYTLYAIGGFHSSMRADHQSKFIGFRCVYDNQPSSKTMWKADILATKLNNVSTDSSVFTNSRLVPLLGYIKDIPPAYISKYLRPVTYDINMANNEVSVAQYQDFLNDLTIQTNIYKHQAEPLGHSRIPARWQQQIAKPNTPVRGVSYWNAYEFANWAQAQLPSYDEFITLHINYPSTTNITAVKRVDSPIHSSSSAVMKHLGDNVAEWSRSIDVSKNNKRFIVYGGSFLLDEASNSVGYYRSINPDSKLPDVGFRVVLF